VVITDATRATFEHAHGVIADTGLIALALGRFGGGSLSHRSDLDLVFMFSGDYRATSNGAKPLSAMHYYNRLAQRVISNLSVATAAGPLYEIDTRLRPSGAKGELCVSFAGFEKYQRNDAWTWEHMALTRARAIYGAYSARLAANAKIRDILMQPHDQATVLRDAIEMRHMIAENKPGGGEYDMKSGEGGLIDLEFCIHVQQLVRSSGFSPSLTEAMGALEFPRDLRAAHDLMTRFLVAQRLLAPDFELPDPARQRLMAQLCKSDNWAQLMAQLKSARTAVRQAWRRSRAGKF
jgi:glutamate-ammonia-ligase adenylyltransferase